MNRIFLVGSVVFSSTFFVCFAENFSIYTGKSKPEVPYSQVWTGTTACSSLEEVEVPQQKQGDKGTIIEFQVCNAQVKLECLGTKQQKLLNESEFSAGFGLLWYPNKCVLTTVVTLTSSKASEAPISASIEKVVLRNEAAQSFEVPLGSSGKSYFFEVNVPSDWNMAPLVSSGLGYQGDNSGTQKQSIVMSWLHEK